MARKCNVCRHDAEPTAQYCANCGAGLPWSQAIPKYEPPPAGEHFNFTMQLVSEGENASVLIIQRGGWGDASMQVSWAVLVDGERVGRLGSNQTRGKVYLEPGMHSVRVRTGLRVESCPVEVATRAGETVRLRCDPVMFGRPTLYLTDDPNTKV